MSFRTFLGIIFLVSAVKAELYQYKTSDDTRIRYEHSRAQGENPLHVLILMGHNEVIEHYATIRNLLNDQGFTTWILEWRGQGGSSRNLRCPDEILYIDSYETYLTDLQAFTKRHLKYINVHVIAHGMGAHILLRYLVGSLSNPFRKITLLNPLTDFAVRNPLKYTYISSSRNPEHLKQWSIIVEDQPINPLVYTVFEEKRGVLGIQMTSSDWYEATLLSLRKWNSISPTHTQLIPNPFLIVWSEQDAIVRCTDRTSLTQRLKNTKSLLAPDAKTCMLHEDVDLLDQLIDRICLYFRSNEYSKL